MKKSNQTALRLGALLLSLLFVLLLLPSCSSNKSTLLTLEKDGIRLSFSVNRMELMMSRMKGTLAYYGQTANGATADKADFWKYTDKFDGETVETIDDYYRKSVLDSCYMALAAEFFFEAEKLSLSDTQKASVEEQLEELIKTDGDGSKTKLNSVLSVYGVNYKMLREAYLSEAKAEAVKAFYYGENASLVGTNLKDEFLSAHYIHFQQIFLPSYRYLTEEDDNGDTVYYYTEGAKEGRIAYDTEGVTRPGNDTFPTKDANGDVIYYTDSTFSHIAYDEDNGKPSYLMTTDGKSYQTEKLSTDELSALDSRANTLLSSLLGKTEEQFETAMNEESEDLSSYTDGYYLRTDLDYSASGEDYAYLEDIVAALLSAEVGDTVMISSPYGYHIIRKYAAESGAYDKEENTTWFETFADDLTEELFAEKCRSVYDFVSLNQEVFDKAPRMADVAVNYYY